MLINVKQLPVHVRVRVRRPSGQGRRPDFGCRARRHAGQDKRARVACETLVKTGVAIVAGEVTTEAWVDLEEIVRGVICDIGYTSSNVGFDGRTCARAQHHRQAVARHRHGRRPRQARRAGRRRPGSDVRLRQQRDPSLMPAPICYAHRLVERQAEVRKSGLLPWLRPDAKSQVTLPLRERQGHGPRRGRALDPARPGRQATRTCAKPSWNSSSSTCCRRNGSTRGHQVPHQPDRQLRHRRPGGRLRPDRAQDHRRQLRRHGPPRRRRVLGQGPVEGRSLGGLCGTLCRQESRRGRASPTAAKSRSRTRSASRSPPRSPSTRSAPARCSQERLEQLVRAHFDLRPYGIIKMLDLVHPMYRATAAYGHFGREPVHMTYKWKEFIGGKKVEKSETLHGLHVGTHGQGRGAAQGRRSRSVPGGSEPRRARHSPETGESAGVSAAQSPPA